MDILNLEPKLSLKVEAQAGDVITPFAVEVPNWDFAEKVKKGQEFINLLIDVDKAKDSILAKAGEASAIGEGFYASMVNELSDITLLDAVKTWVKANILAISGFDFKLSETETVTTLRKDHEKFDQAYEALWAKDYLFDALLARFRTHFSRAK